MRYIEVLGHQVMGRIDLLDDDPLAGYTIWPHHTDYLRNGQKVMNIGEFTRKNVKKWLETVSVFSQYGVEDFHAVCDDMEIPWAKEESRNEYQSITERAAAREAEERKTGTPILGTSSTPEH